MNSRLASKLHVGFNKKKQLEIGCVRPSLYLIHSTYEKKLFFMSKICINSACLGRPSSKYNIVSWIPTKSTTSNNENSNKILKREALIKLQEVYNNFRTRRLVEQICWKILEFAELKRSSISFFNKEKHETAISRWLRATTRAAKVGKGLSKNDKALKLTLPHWLEAIDPQHRYGHNLHFYYDKWSHSNSKEPFFYWLDFGAGKELDLIKMCPRSKLQQQCIMYLGPMERIAYEVVVDDGKFLLKQRGELLHTTGDAKWIFVLSTSKTLYVGQKKKGTFQHSSFLAGGATIAAGTLVVEYGVLKAVWPHSSHYKPKMENLKDFVSFLRENNVDLTDVKMTSSVGNQTYSSSEKEVAQTLNILETELINLKDLVHEKTDSVEEGVVALERPKTMRFHNLEIPKKDEMIGGFRLQNDHVAVRPICNDSSMDSLVEDVYRTSEEAFTPKQQIVDESCKEIENIAQESILLRANSEKKSNSPSPSRYSEEMRSYMYSALIYCKEAFLTECSLCLVGRIIGWCINQCINTFSIKHMTDGQDRLFLFYFCLNESEQ